MEIIIYSVIFIIGTLFGSFFTLAVYRIPLGENIVYKHSFCPNCKEKLKFKDLIPIFSYIFLGGKCAYCGKKIRIRYLLLEVLSGMVFLLFAISLKINFFSIDFNKIEYFSMFLLYIASLFIIAGIDKENKNVQRSLLVFGLVLSSCYMTYVCIHDIQAIYTYIIYLVLTIVLLIADIIYTKKKMAQSYVIGCLMLILYMIVFTGSKLTYITIACTLILLAIETLVIKLKKNTVEKNETKKNIKLPIAFNLSIINILVIIISNFLYNWVM